MIWAFFAFCSLGLLAVWLLAVVLRPKTRPVEERLPDLCPKSTPSSNESAGVVIDLATRRQRLSLARTSRRKRLEP